VSDPIDNFAESVDVGSLFSVEPDCNVEVHGGRATQIDGDYAGG
jgi:hypothetical protein